MPAPLLTYDDDPDWTITGFTAADRAAFALEEEIINLPGTPDTSDEADGHQWDETSSSGSLNRWRAYIDEEEEFATVAMESLDPAVGERDATGGIVALGSGTCRIRLSYPGKEPWITRQTMRTVSVAETARLTGLSADSLVEHCHTGLAALIAGLTAGADTQRYLDANNLDPDTPAVTLNAAHFAAALDFSAVSVMSESSGTPQENRHVALVSELHATCAKHFAPGVGDRVVFRRSNGTYQVSEVDSITDISGDLSVIEFTGAVTGLTPFECVSQAQLEDFAPKVAALGSLHALLGVRRTRHFADGTVGSGLLPQLFTHNSGSVSYAYIPALERIYDFVSSAYGAPGGWIMPLAKGGDSGGPSFLIIDGTPVLLGHAHTVYGFPLVAGTSWLAAVNTALGAYTIAHPDLSSFTDFS